MKLLLDFLPLILFFSTFKWAEGHADAAGLLATQYLGGLVSGGSVGAKEAPVMLATAVVIAATLTQVLVLKLLRRKVDLMLWISLVLVVVLGGLTLWFHNDTFIKWKPSGLYWTFGLVLWFSQAVLGKNLLARMLSAELTLPPAVWRKLNTAWVLFFAGMGLLNLWVAYHFEQATWVNFKVFGATGLMLVFTIAQGMYLSRHLQEEAPDASPPAA